MVSDECIFQIECKKRKLDHLSKAGASTENGGLDKFLTDVAREVDKFPQKGQDIMDGKVESIKFKKQRFINIIVYLDEMFAMNLYARESVKGKMKNKQFE
jgi:hypothetical protein